MYKRSCVQEMKPGLLEVEAHMLQCFPDSLERINLQILPTSSIKYYSNTVTHLKHTAEGSSSGGVGGPLGLCFCL